MADPSLWKILAWTVAACVVIFLARPIYDVAMTLFFGVGWN